MNPIQNVAPIASQLNSVLYKSNKTSRILRIVLPILIVLASLVLISGILAFVAVLSLPLILSTAALVVGGVGLAILIDRKIYLDKLKHTHENVILFGAPCEVHFSKGVTKIEDAEVIIFGENHIDKKHKDIEGKLIKQLFQTGDRLLLEGAPENIQYFFHSKQLNQRFTAFGWEDPILLQRSLQNTITLMQRLLITEKKEKLTLLEYYDLCKEFVKNHLSCDLREIYQSFESDKTNTTDKWKILLKLELEIVNYIESLLQNASKIETLRDKQLVTAIKNAKIIAKRIFAIAGSLHVLDKKKSYNALDNLENLKCIAIVMESNESESTQDLIDRLS